MDPSVGQAELGALLEAAPIAMIAVDTDGRIVLVNQQVERLFGYDRSELLNAPVEQLVPPRFRGLHADRRLDYAAHPAARQMGAGRDLFGLRKDGGELPVEIGLSPIDTPRGRVVLATVIDISERKRSEKLRLQSATDRRRRLDAEADRDRAVDASNLKSQFVATMSHELRTPLSAIIGLSELMASTDLGDRQRNYVERINASAEALLGVINSILDMSKIEAGKVQLERQPFDLEALVSGTTDLLAQQARQKGLALHTSIDSAIPPVLEGDRDRLRQVLLNLAGNAIKFTDRGEVAVRAVAERASGRRVRVRFEVEDSGIGIPSDVLPTVFEPFVQADPSSARRFGGTGLGLSISKRLVELMGGEIRATSSFGSGSLFSFTVEFHAAEPAASIEPAGSSVARAALDHTAPVVLIAEDNRGMHEVLASQFARLGIGAKIVSDGAEAVYAVQHGDFALVFMDCQMPTVDGFEATRLIRAHEIETGKHTPIIAMTANAFKQDRDACLAAGMDDHLAKPVRLREIQAMVRKWLIGRRVVSAQAAERGAGSAGSYAPGVVPL